MRHRIDGTTGARIDAAGGGWGPRPGSGTAAAVGAPGDTDTAVRPRVAGTLAVADRTAAGAAADPATAGHAVAGPGVAGAVGGGGEALRGLPPVRAAGRWQASPDERPAGWPATGRGRRPGPKLLLFPADLLAVLVVAIAIEPDPAMQLAAPPAVGFSYAALGLYRSRLTLSVLDDLPRLLAGVAVGVAAGLAFSAQVAPPLADVLRTVLAAAVAVLVPRALGYPLARRYRRWRPGAPTVIVGSAQLGRELGEIFVRHPEFGLWPVGYLDAAAAAGTDRRRTDLPAPLLGDHRDLAWVIRALEIRHVVVAFGALRRSALVEMLRTCSQLRCEVLVVPRLFEFQQRGRDVDHVRGIPLLRLRRAALLRPSWRVKRAMDVVVAAVGLALAVPVLAVCALAVRLEGGPGVVFRQERVGLHGRRFQILKLRSLRPSSQRESQTQWTVAGDRRIGPVGRLLRATSLDELPQLVNVLRGEMSLVGPRPERPFFVEQFGRHYPRYADRHRVPAGLTGWAAVNGLRGDTSIVDRIRYDNDYIENWSLWLDIKIMVRTVGSILTRAGG